MGPKIGLNLHAKSLKRSILGAQLRVLKPPKKLQLTLLKPPPIQPTCLIYANWGRGKKLKHGVPKKKREVAKKPKRAPKFGFFEPKNQKRAPNLGFFCQKTQRQPIFWGFLRKFVNPPPPQCLNPEAQNPGGLNLHAWNDFFAETSVLFFGIRFWTIIAKTKIWENFTP